MTKKSVSRAEAFKTFGFALPRDVSFPLLLGMVHVRALPGTPYAALSMGEIVNIAVEEALAYKAVGFDGIILENMHDRPYLKGHVGPEITAAMTLISARVREEVGAEYPLGVQILAGANLEALAVAHTAGLNFIRAEGFVFAHTADEGWIEACAAELLRERRRLGAEKVRIWTDIQKKHSAHAVTSDLTLSDWAHGAEFFGADGLIITGARTGCAANEDHLEEVKKSTHLPVAIGSGITPENAPHFAAADAWIIGSSIKQGGNWANPLDFASLKRMVSARKALKPVVKGKLGFFAS
ncbi:MAG: BtpA/SgcQ family protein [Candidatus Riflebacteria bacterium]|nr:BtpA/SgcQ family protein [Candidatus Riflebacteria bacterium]